MRQRANGQTSPARILGGWGFHVVRAREPHHLPSHSRHKRKIFRARAVASWGSSILSNARQMCLDFPSPSFSRCLAETFTCHPGSRALSRSLHKSAPREYVQSLGDVCNLTPAAKARMTLTSARLSFCVADVISCGRVRSGQECAGDLEPYMCYK